MSPQEQHEYMERLERQLVAAYFEAEATGTLGRWLKDLHKEVLDYFVEQMDLEESEAAEALQSHLQGVLDPAQALIGLVILQRVTMITGDVPALRDDLHE